MENGKRIYQIEINGLKESIDQVESLRKQLDMLSAQIDALEKKTISIKVDTPSTQGVSTNSSSSNSTRNTSSLNEEVALEKEINNLKNEGVRLDAKIEAAQTEIYQKVQATKDLYKETINDQKQLAAQERMAANAYSNTMMGMKQKLADLKTMINTTDLGDSDKLKQMTKEANELTNKLKQMEEAYGQFGRNVGNYQSAAEGFNKIKVAVGDTVREYTNYRQAAKALKEERFQLAQSLGQEAQAYKDVDVALKRLESDYSDLNKSSKTMDNLLDTMETFTAFAGIEASISQLFGIDNSTFDETIKKLTSLFFLLKSIETINKQWKSDDSPILGWFKRFDEKLDDLANRKSRKAAQEFILNFGDEIRSEARNAFDFMDDEIIFNEIQTIRAQQGKANTQIEGQNLEEYWKSLSEEQKKVFYENEKLSHAMQQNMAKASRSVKLLTGAFKFLRRALMGLASFGIGLLLTELLERVGDFVQSLDTSKTKAEQLNQELKALNKSLETERDILGSKYLKGQINDEEYLKGIYESQNEALVKQLELVRELSSVNNKASNTGGLGGIFASSNKNLEFTGERVSFPKTVGHGALGSIITLGLENGIFGKDLEVTVKDIKEVENAWKNCQKAIKEGQDYLEANGSGLSDLFNSLFVTVKDTEEIMRGMGNLKLSDFIGQFQAISKQYSEGEIGARVYAAELKRLKNEMNDNKVLNSVIANLDKYIPDEKVREAVQNIINEITRLDDAFNMTSPQQVHYWNQVRIEGMKEGWGKTKAMIDENEDYEIKQYAHTQEQIDLIHAKYDQQRREARKKANKDAQSKNKEHQEKMRAAEDEYQRLIIELMKNGLDKQLAQLDEEKRQKLRKIKDNGVRTTELSELTEQVYAKRIEEVRKEWAKKTEDAYASMWTKIYQINHNAQQMNFETQLKELDTHYKKLQEKVNDIISEVSSAWSSPSAMTNTIKVRTSTENTDDVYMSNADTAVKDREKRYTEILREEFNARIANRKRYYEESEKLTIEKLTKQKEIEESAATESMNDELRTLKNGYAAEDNALEERFKNGELTQKQYKEITSRLTKERATLESNIEEKYAADSKARLQKFEEDKKKIKAEYREDELNEYEKYLNKLAELDSSTPEIGWTGLINYAETKRRNNDLVKSYQDTFNKIQAYINNLNAHKAEYDPVDFDKLMTNAKNAQSSITSIIKNINENTKITGKELAQQIISMADQSMQQIQSIMSSLSEISQNQYEAQIAQQEEYISKYEELLQKQEDITKEHADKVNDIEDELKNARGDRRQQLIDQLNAEMAAQRASLSQEKKIEKEKEKAERQKKKLEHDQAVAKKRMDLAQAYINMAMAISMAAVNKWPLPAIPMMALAAAAGAAQIAAIQSQNIPSYGDGGVIQGKSHAQGGVKVLGGRAEVEGGEFITNKVTTTRNVELLEFINTRKKKINLDDMLEFYVGKRSNVKKVITNASPRTRFADGGVIPSLRSDFEFNDRLVDTMEAYANRPVWVAVTDIEDAQANVNYVRTLSGMKN